MILKFILMAVYIHNSKQYLQSVYVTSFSHIVVTIDVYGSNPLGEQSGSVKYNMHSISVIIRQIHCSATVGIYPDMNERTTRFHLDWLLPFTLLEESFCGNLNFLLFR